MATRRDRIALYYTLKFTTPFHFGTGTRVGLIDRTVIRDSGEFLYVPGSTFKGVLREHCEQLARFYTPESYKNRIFSPHNPGAMIFAHEEDNPSMITRLFGSQQVPGTLFFDDLHQPEPVREGYVSDIGADLSEPEKKRWLRRYKSIQVDNYTQVRIDRPTRTAVKGALYTSEFGLKGMTFEGAIMGWLECTPLVNSNDPMTPTYSLLLLLAGLRTITRLGGNKSSGKGECTCTISTLKVNDFQYAEKQCEEQCEAWLERLDELADYPGFGGISEGRD